MNRHNTAPLVLHRKLSKEEKLKKGTLVAEAKQDGSKNKQTGNDINKRKLEKGLIGPPRVTPDLAQGITKARVAKKLTREKLAEHIQVNCSVIVDLETPNKTITVDKLDKVFIRLNRVLCTNFKKPKPIELGPEEDNQHRE